MEAAPLSARIAGGRPGVKYRPKELAANLSAGFCGAAAWRSEWPPSDFSCFRIKVAVRFPPYLVKGIKTPSIEKEKAK